MEKRALILSTVVVFGFVLVVVRLVDLMLVSHKRLSEKARLQQMEEKKTLAYRGIIYDRKGRELAVNIDTDSLYCNPGEINSPEKVAVALSSITGEDLGDIRSKISADKKFVWVKRKLDRERSADLNEHPIKGVGLMPEVKRFYPKGILASHVIGFVGVDNQPLAGIELTYEKRLKGMVEKVEMSKDAGGRTLSEGIEFGRQGESVVLTIDEGLQFALEVGLDRAIDEWKAASATAIMLDPFTGEILAMASRPTYDPNDPSVSEVSGRRNRAITDTYEPGSTFKLVTATGVLESGLVDTETRFNCSAGKMKINGMTIQDVHNNGVLTFREVIQTSSNVGTVMAAMRLGNKLYDYAERFGFGKRTGVDLPGEARGKIKPPREWSGTTLPAMAMGYEVSVTPLQVLRAYSVIANGGFLIRPHVVSRVLSPEGGVVYEFKAEKTERIISKAVADTLREILISVTEKGGTASEASIEGNRVAGKTGTSKLLEGGRYTKKYASSFVGFVPADDPKVALIVVVSEPKGQYYGGLVAAPIFKDIAERTLSYLNVPRDDTFEKNTLVVRANSVRSLKEVIPKVEGN